VEAERERGKVKWGGSVNMVKIKPCSFFALPDQVAG